jgi:hypothetical protein
MPKGFTVPKSPFGQTVFAASGPAAAPDSQRSTNWRCQVPRCAERVSAVPRPAETLGRGDVLAIGMMSKIASEYLVEALEKTGVKRVYGVVGDSLNGFTDALRRRRSIDWIHMRQRTSARCARSHRELGRRGFQNIDIHRRSAAGAGRSARESQSLSLS